MKTAARALAVATIVTGGLMMHGSATHTGALADVTTWCDGTTLHIATSSGGTGTISNSVKCQG
ncbi:hypothetical protein [Flexivirga sp. B27]